MGETILVAATLIAAVVVPFIIWKNTKNDEQRQLEGRDRKRKQEKEDELAEIKKKQEEEFKKREKQLEELERKAKEAEKRIPQIIHKNLEVLIIGRRGVGKTQLIWTEQGKDDKPNPTMEKTMEEILRATIIDNVKYTFDYIIPDIGGEDTFLGDINEELVSRRPSGIIFMVDHNDDSNPSISKKRLEAHMNTLYSILGTLGNKNRSRCKTILFLINKQDIWSKNYSAEEIISCFREHINRIGNIGINVIVECVSAINGSNLSRAFNKFETTLMA